MTEVASAAELRRTALNSVHRQLKARMVPFGGWDMPVEYSGIIPEHMAVRTRAGLFDVSHMGEIEIRGSRALDLVQYVCCNDASRLAQGQAQYSGLMTSNGTFVDDLLVHKFADDHYFLVVNASNADKDFSYITEHNRWPNVVVKNTSDRFAQLAIQGPKAIDILQRLATVELAPIRYYWFTRGEVAGVPAMIARTGYTGEDGFEIYFDPAAAERVWSKLLDAGQPEGIIPCGLGARNTLRLEAGMPLYGHEIDDTTTPWEANLGWICKMNKGAFLGRDRLEVQKRDGIERQLAGFEMLEAGIARDGYSVLLDGRSVGNVTSGSPAPALGKNIGMTYLPVDQAVAGTEIEVQIRSRTAKARLVPMPFYKRAR